MEVRYGIRANHGGFLKCRICDDPNNMSEACFNQHILKTCGPCSPHAHLTMCCITHRGVAIHLWCQKYLLQMSPPRQTFRVPHNM